MYTAPVKFPAQALHVTEEAILEVDLPVPVKPSDNRSLDNQGLGQRVD